MYTFTFPPPNWLANWPLNALSFSRSSAKLAVSGSGSLTFRLVSLKQAHRQMKENNDDHLHIHWCITIAASRAGLTVAGPKFQLWTTLHVTSAVGHTLCVLENIGDGAR